MSTAFLAYPNQTINNAYTFASPPTVAPHRKKKDKERPQYFTNSNTTFQLGNNVTYANIMFDKRVFRGTTFDLRHLSSAGSTAFNRTMNKFNTSSMPPYQTLLPPIEKKKELLPNINKGRYSLKCANSRSAIAFGTPEPVEGRMHMEMQTELYLEELRDYKEEEDLACQTDPFLDRPVTPFYIPAKTGVDRETQILEGELFDFDLEVQPILEVLVGKIAEQSLKEIMEEEELACLREQQRMFEEMRNVELQEQQRLEEQELRRKKEKEMRIRQQEILMQQEQITAEKVAAKIFANKFLADLIPNVFGLLTENGYFNDPVELDIENNFLPWLHMDVKWRLEQNIKYRKILDGIIENVVKKKQEAYNEGLETEIDFNSYYDNSYADAKPVLENGESKNVAAQIKN